MEHKGKLELTWVGKYDDKVIEPRILVEDREKSYGDPHSENMLIHGDNLIALQALQQDFAGKIKASILIHHLIPDKHLKITMTISRCLSGLV